MGKSFYGNAQILLILTIVASSLFTVGYWSTFNFNVLVLYDFSELITSILFPFLSTLMGVILCAILLDYFATFIQSLVEHRDRGFVGNEDSKKRRILNFIFFLMLRGFCVYVAIVSFKVDYNGWLIAPFFIWLGFHYDLIKFFYGASYELNNLNVKLTRYLFLIILYSFAIGKHKAIQIMNNDKFEFVKVESDTLKVIGGTRDKIIVLNLKNENIKVLKRDMAITDYYYFEKTSIPYKTDLEEFRKETLK